MYPKCMLDIIILAQAVLHIFFHKIALLYKMQKGHNSAKYLERFAKSFYQVICTLDSVCMPNIMVLAQAFLQIFCSQGPLWV